MKLFKNFNNFINKEFSLSSKDNLFRQLTYKEKQAVEVYDFRDISLKTPNDNVIITCEHASNERHKYKFSRDQELFLESHWGYDIGAKDITLELAEEAKVLSVNSNFTRLIIDPNRSLLSNTLIRKYIDKNVQIEINKEENLDEEKRIELYYLPYYKILKECLTFLKPKFALSVHSFTKQYENQPERNFEVGILFKNRGLFADMIESKYRQEGVNYKINEPYKPSDGTCNVIEGIETFNQPDWKTDAVMLEFRDDLCIDEAFRNMQVSILSSVIKELKDKTN